MILLKAKNKRKDSPLIGRVNLFFLVRIQLILLVIMQVLGVIRVVLLVLMVAFVLALRVPVNVFLLVFWVVMVDVKANVALLLVNILNKNKLYIKFRIHTEHGYDSLQKQIGELRS